MPEDDEFDPIDYFSNPKEPAQKRYEVLRAYFLESLTQKEAAKRAGYSLPTFQSLVSNFQNQKIDFFMVPQYGPNRRQISDFIQKRVVSLRKSNQSVYEIKDILSKEGFDTSIQTINRIIKDEGFAKLPRRTKEELGLTKKNTLLPPISTAIDLEQLESHKFECQVGGIYYFIPYILQTGLYEMISSAPFPETSKLSKINSIFSILALKLIGHERLSKISSYNHDTGFGFFAGLNVPPKTTATSTYSYMVDKETIQSFMEEFISHMSSTYPQYYQGDTIKLHEAG